MSDAYARLEQMRSREEARIDLSGPIAEICELLGLDENAVARLDITPPRLVAEIFILRDGKKYVHEDGEVPFTRHTFDIRS